MNAAFGEPSRESLPFDLASYHFPITYDLPEGASQDERRAAPEKLADEFERALKGASLATNISRAYLSLYLCHTAIRSTGEPGLGKEGNLSAGDSGARRTGFRGERENDSGVKTNRIPG